MFGSNLSSIAERKAREGTSGGRKAKTDAAAPDIPSSTGGSGTMLFIYFYTQKENILYGIYYITLYVFSIAGMSRPPLPASELLYDESNPPPRGVLVVCLQDVTAKMNDLETARNRAIAWASYPERVSFLIFHISTSLLLIHIILLSSAARIGKVFIWSAWSSN